MIFIQTDENEMVADFNLLKSIVDVADFDGLLKIMNKRFPSRKFKSISFSWYKSNGKQPLELKGNSNLTIKFMYVSEPQDEKEEEA